MKHRLSISILALAWASASPADTPADLVFVNGAVYTVDAARSWASALAVSGDRISYVGEDAVARTLVGPGTRLVDLGGRMLLPGFQDVHVHPGMVADPEDTVKLDGIMRSEDVLEAIRLFADSHPDAPWIQGGGWDEGAFLPGGLPNRQMLDAVIPDRPVYLYNNSGHATWSNSAALKMAGINAATLDPVNGHIQRDAQGEPTGVLHETAMSLMDAVIPPATHEDNVRNLAAALEVMKRLGITGLSEAMATEDIAAAYKTLDEQGRLQQHSTLCLNHDPELDDETQIARFLALREDLASPQLQAGCVKLFLDGAYASHTLLLLEPYSDDPETYGRGKLFIPRERLIKLVTRLDAEGFQVHMHAQGDGAVREGLDAIAAARKANGFRDNRHVIAHLCLIDDTDLLRFRELGVIASFSPLWSKGDPWEAVFAPILFGPERASTLFKTRSALDAGVMIAWGSDWDVTSVSPLEGLETAITHRYPGGKDPEGNSDATWNPGERVNLAQAIAAYTSAGAYVMHGDQSRGSLEAGKLADLVVLDRNLFDTPELEIHHTRVMMTVIGGQIVHEQ